MSKLDDLKTEGFYIKHVEREQWDKWADKIQEVTGLEWNTGVSLSSTFNYKQSSDIGYDVRYHGITHTWEEATIASVPFHYENLEEFVYDIGLLKEGE